MSASVASPDERAPQPVPPPEAAEVVALPSARGVAGGLVRAMARPRPLARETVRLGRDFAAILRGTDRLAPSEHDERFTDPAWREHPGYRRLGQAYLAWGSSLARMVDQYEAEGADWHAVERARFALHALTGGMAPTNTLLGNPAALRRAIDTGGRSVLQGMGHLVEDLRHHGGLPAHTDRAEFAVGRNLGATRGAVVYRDDVVELLQYKPSTQQVRQRPLVIVPPPIGRFYFLDLRPGRSFTEYAVGQGLQVFLISWRNPTRQHAGWTLDTYAERIRRAIGVAREITGSPDVNTMGFCAGGILLTTLLTHLAAIADHSVHSAGYAATLLDFAAPAPIAAFAGRRLGAGRRVSRPRGVIPARTMQSAFSWIHPDELVFHSLVHQWLMGEDPPASDLLAWYADGTNLPAALHAQFLQIFRDNSLLRPGALTVLGTPVDLGEITLPTLVLAAADDQLTPWTGCYRTTQLLSGPATFLLSSGGHLQSLITPPGNPRACYWTGGAPEPDPEDWRAAAERHTGSWWQAWAPWTIARSGDQVPAPAQLGSGLHPPLQPAPGSYVLDRPPA
ncbi:PHA/PHB synthase family protein [Blastococcus mobilis]|uniref:Polyhydroxyalkanoate synthase n=1 Tax=Blastococcus mobilis TaxID=1938746 RepID=A0A238Z9L1_9ACTN|nr:alpha/beta fold hydrolase [Blastococcus mobilis]SNR79759.1 polyhydroxyalkanoate synthase [Blastococcus mobilis]